MGKRVLLITKLWLKDVQKAIGSLLNISSGIAALCVMVMLILDIGFHLEVTDQALFATFYRYLMLYFMGDLIFRLVTQPQKVTYFFRNPTDIFVFYPLVLLYVPPPEQYVYGLGQLALGLVMVGRLKHWKAVFFHLKVKPAQLFILGFLFIIFIGSLLLSLPVAVSPGASVSYLDALFTSFSAVCVTGLAVNDIGVTFSFFGQLVILGLIQIGGLGIMTFSVLLAFLLHHKVSHSFSKEYRESFSTFNLKDTFKTILFIIRFTILFEILGVVILFFGWYGYFPTQSQTFYYAVFHSISAFCNAGFSLFSDSLMGFSNNPIILLGIAALIIVGGLGLPVLYNLSLAIEKKYVFRRLKLQTKIALLLSVILIVFGSVMIFLGEYNYALAGMPLQEKLLASFFQSVSARTAGFNSIELTLLHPATIVMMMSLMIIGASPGSTGGGIKTTTLGLLVISFWNTLRSSDRIDIARRTVSFQVVLKAFSLLFLGVILILAFFYLLLFSEDKGFLQVLFETVSAFGTVGFSLGITDQLSNVGKGIIMIVMFIGRIGPLTVAVALARPNPEVHYAYPEENVMIG